MTLFMLQGIWSHALTIYWSCQHTGDALSRDENFLCHRNLNQIQVT